jgi:hypothetical protein
MSDLHLETPDSVGATFGFGEVPPAPPAEGVAEFAATTAAADQDPPLGALTPFTGRFQGSGFNTIFRPDSSVTPTKDLPAGDNVLELNLTQETLWFMPPLGSVPNRGEITADAFLNGVPYLQTIADVTQPGRPPITIHVEPGLWMIVPPTQDPHEPGTLVRMASIPHGTAITAQGGSSQLRAPFDMKKIIPPIDITPFGTSDPRDVIPVGSKRANAAISFDSQTAANESTARIPQNLKPFSDAKTITQAMLTDPATFIRNHSAQQNITSIVEITVNTKHGQPLFGGGALNIGFLLGDPQAGNPNAQAVNMTATFWIQTVEYTIQVPAFQPGQPPLKIAAEAGAAGQPVPSFLIDPPVPVPAPRTIKASATQIQYAQQVFLNFAGITWPHASVATLVPQAPVPVPAAAWT